jgi:hypothetical protein
MKNKEWKIRFLHNGVKYGTSMKKNESDESFLSQVKQEENERSHIRYELSFKISNNYDIVLLMIIYNFVDKFSSRFRYNHLLAFAGSFPKYYCFENLYCMTLRILNQLQFVCSCS